MIGIDKLNKMRKESRSLGLGIQEIYLDKDNLMPIVVDKQKIIGNKSS